MQKRKKDLLLVAVVLILAAGGFLINAINHKKPAATVEVTVDGKQAASYVLSQDTDVVIPGYGGGSNHLIIQDGAVWISEASCPDKVCIHQGRISRNGEMIVCLPNRMIAQIVAPEE